MKMMNKLFKYSLCQVLCLRIRPREEDPPNSSAREIFQARILDWVALSFSMGIFPTQGLNWSLSGLLPWQAASLPLAPPGKPTDQGKGKGQTRGRFQRFLMFCLPDFVGSARAHVRLHCTTQTEELDSHRNQLLSKLLAAKHKELGD